MSGGMTGDGVRDRRPLASTRAPVTVINPAQLSCLDLGWENESGK